MFNAPLLGNGHCHGNRIMADMSGTRWDATTHVSSKSFILNPNFYIFVEILQLQFGITPTSEFLYVITNHATDATKAIIQTVNIKFRKLKKNNVRNTNKTWQLKQDSHSKCSDCPAWAFTRVCSVGSSIKEVLWK